VVLTRAQAEAYSGARGLVPASSLLSSAGIPNGYHTPGPGLPTGVRMEHVSVRAFLPFSNYRGVGRPGSARGWIPLAPAIKQVRTQTAVDLRDAVSFDFDAYLGQVTAQKPSEAYFEQLRGYVRANDLRCETLESAQPLQQVVPGNYPILPADLPVLRLDRLAVGAALPDDRRHLVTLRAETSLGAAQFTHAVPMAALWGKSVTVTYEAADAASAAAIASHGGIEQTPSYLVRLRPVLKLDGVVVATGLGENPGLRHSLWVTTRSPASGDTQVEHALSVGGVFAFTFDAGAGARGSHQRAAEAAGRADGRRRRGREAARRWSQLLPRAGAGAAADRRAALAPGLQGDRGDHGLAGPAGEPAPRGPGVDHAGVFHPGRRLIKSGNFAIDGDHHRRVQIARWSASIRRSSSTARASCSTGPASSRRCGCCSWPRAGGVTVLTFNEGGLDEALGQIGWPAEFEERLADAARSGRRVQAPVAGARGAGLGTLYGYIATDLELGAGEYIVAFESGVANAMVHGGVGDAGGGGEGGGGDGGAGCLTCQASLPSKSTVHALSGNYVDQSTDLTLPARGIPLAFTRTYSALLGWHHNYGRHLTANADGSLTYTDETGVARHFAAAGAGAGAWSPPPTFFQRIATRAAGGWTMTFPDGMAYDFDAAGRLVVERDLNGNQVTLSYGADGRLATVTGVGGGTLTFRHDGAGRLDRVSDSAGRQVNFGYDAAGMLTSETDVNNKSRTRGYDAAGRMIRKTDFRGNVTQMFYDDSGRVVRVEDAEGGVFSYAYDARNRRTAMTDRLGNVSLWELNADAQPLRLVDAVGNETRMVYDARGNKLTETSPRGHVETMTYNTDGNLLTRRDASNALTTYTYGPHARLLTITDADNRVTENTYDTDGKLQTTKDATNAITSYGYGPGGLPTSITRPGNVTTTMGYDPAGNVTSMIDPENGETVLGYDGAGHLTSMRDPNNRTRTMVVDAKGQMQSMRDARDKVTSFTYDDDGNRLTVTTPDEAVTTSAYDKLGRLVSSTDPLGNVTRQEYDAEGRVTARIDARGFRTTMTYDPIGRLVATRDPAGYETRMNYCAELAQQPCAIVDALGNVTTVAEDELGRETERRDPLGNVVRTGYDLLGRRTSVTDPAGKQTRFEYDVIGRLTKVIDTAGGETVYGYDGRGNRTRVEDANHHATTFEYDGANRLFREITPITTATEFGYDLAGNRTRKLDGKAQNTGFVYDENRRLTDHQLRRGRGARHLRIRRRRQPPAGTQRRQRAPHDLRRRRPPAHGAGRPDRPHHHLRLRRRRKPHVDAGHAGQRDDHVRLGQPRPAQPHDRPGGRRLPLRPRRPRPPARTPATQRHDPGQHLRRRLPRACRWCTASPTGRSSRASPTPTTPGATARRRSSPTAPPSCTGTTTCPG
jgi:YD repeat-containing protein